MAVSGEIAVGTKAAGGEAEGFWRFEEEGEGGGEAFRVGAVEVDMVLKIWKVVLKGEGSWERKRGRRKKSGVHRSSPSSDDF